MKNEYQVRGEITAIILQSKKFGDMETLISTSNLHHVQEFHGTWYPVWSKKTKSFRVMGSVYGGGKKKNILLHRLILNTDQHVDHINNNTLDNTNSNLRIVSNAENHQNRKGANANNKCGIRGVYWRKDQNKWHARIGINGKQLHLGFFENLEDAERVVMDSRLNNMPYSKEALAT